MLCHIRYSNAIGGSLMVPAWFPASTAGRETGRGRAVPAVLLAAALAAKAFANTKAAPSMVVKGTGVSTGTAGQTVTFDLTLVQKAGCQGTIAQSKTERFQLVEA